MSDLRLELGCGRFPHPGYKTIDVESYANPDYLGDFRTMDFTDVEEIRSHHLLEHFDRKEVIEVLKLWHKWLKPRGTIVIETPDVEQICYFFTHPTKCWANRETLVRALYGSQEAGWAYHKDGWYEEKYREVLPQVGFEIINLKHVFNHTKGMNGCRYRLPNIYVYAKKI